MSGSAAYSDIHSGIAVAVIRDRFSAGILTASRGVRFVDVRMPDSPRLAGTWDDREPGGHEARWLALIDGRLYVPSKQELSGTRIAVVDIGDPDAPHLVERIDLQDVDGYVTTTAGTGAHLFVGCHAPGSGQYPCAASRCTPGAGGATRRAG